MALKRFFINDIDLEVNTKHKLINDEFKYIVNVIRLKTNDQIIICNNTGYDFLCLIESIDKKSVEIKVLEKNKNLTESKINLTICQALVKGDKFELITQKITELGASCLVPFVSKFTIVKQNTNKIARLNKIAEGASRQCGRAKTLNIDPIVDISRLTNKLKEFDLVLLAYEQANTPLKKVLKDVKAKNIAVIVGSEGGFSKDEVDYLKNKLDNLKIVSLGKRILRAETAAITLASIVMYELGELE